MKIKQMTYLFLISSMITAVFMSIMILVKTPKSIKKIEVTSPSEQKIIIKKDEVLSQYIQSQMDDINQLSIYIGKTTDSIEEVKINVYKNNKLVDSSTKKLPDLNINQYNIFEFNKLKNLKGDILKFEIISNSKEMQLSTNKVYNKNQYIIKDKDKLNKSLTLTYIGEQKNIGYIWYFILYFTISLLLFIFIKDEIKENGAK